MKAVLKHYSIHTLAVISMLHLVPALSISGNGQGILTSSLILTLLFLIIKPILSVILFPLHLLTLNLSQWLTNTLIATVWILAEPHTHVAPWDFQGISTGFLTISRMHLSYWPAVLSVSLILVIIIQLYQWVFD